MKDTVETILTQLKEKGARITPVRRAIVEIFVRSSESPVSAVDILDILKKTRKSVNKTTVYREIAFLSEEEIIDSINLGEDQKRYELKQSHHHHIVCQNCKIIEEIEIPEIEQILKKTEGKILRQSKFQSILHSLEFFGICSRCKV